MLCECYTGGNNQLVVCDACASVQIEARNALAPGQVELVPGTLFTTEECDALEASVTNFFAQVKLGTGEEAINDPICRY